MEGVQEELGFEAGAFGRGSGRGGVGGRGRGNGDGEVEFAEEGPGEVGVGVAAFEDEAVEFAVRDRDGPVGFFFAAAGEAGEEAGVEDGHPARLAGGAPVLQDEEHAGRVVDVRVAAGGEEDAEEVGVGGKRHDVGALADFVAFDVFDRVEEGGAAVAVGGAVAHG